MSAIKCPKTVTHAGILKVDWMTGLLTPVGLMPLKRKKNGKTAIKAAMQAYTRTKGAGDSPYFVAFATNHISIVEAYAAVANKILAEYLSIRKPASVELVQAGNYEVSYQLHDFSIGIHAPTAAAYIDPKGFSL